MSIITTIKAGNEKTFTEVYYQYYAKLLGYFIKKTKSEEIAIELVQIVFIKLWNFKHTLTEEVSFDTQIFNIARTSLIDFIRQQSLQKARTVSLQQHQDIDATTLPDNNFEVDDYFNSVIKSLPPVRKKVFTLNRLQGLSYKEIAQYLSISINTVEDHMAKAMRQIRTTLPMFFW